MNITRSQSILLALLCLVVFFVIGLVYSQLGRVEMVRDIKKVELTFDSNGGEGAQVVLNEFQRSETKDGKKKWEIKGKRGTYSPSTNIARVSEADLWFYRPSGEVIHLLAEHATVKLEGAALSTADLEGSVLIRVENKDLTVTTERALYSKEENLVHAPGAVHLSSEMGDLSGTSLLAHIDTMVFVLERDVQSVIKGKKEK